MNTLLGFYSFHSIIELPKLYLLKGDSEIARIYLPFYNRIAYIVWCWA